MKKLLVITLTLILAVTVLSGCDQEAPPSPNGTPNTSADVSPSPATATAWDYIKNKGELIVGLDDTFEPMGFNKDGEIVGFDIDLANEVGKTLGVKITFKPIAWDSKDMELNSKRIDCIWNGMSDTPERRETMALTQPYLNNELVIMGRQADQIKTFDDLAGKKLGIQQKSSALEAVENHEIHSKISNDILELPTYDEIILAMKGGRVNLTVVDKVLANYKNAKLPEAEKLTFAGVSFGDDKYVVGCRKGETDLVEKIEEGIKAAISSGKAKEISEKWFGSNIVLDLK